MYAQLYASPPLATARRADLPAAVDSVLATALAKDRPTVIRAAAGSPRNCAAALGLRSGERPARRARASRFPQTLAQRTIPAAPILNGPILERPDPERPDPETARS